MNKAIRYLIPAAILSVALASLVYLTVGNRASKNLQNSSTSSTWEKNATQKDKENKATSANTEVRGIDEKTPVDLNRLSAACGYHITMGIKSDDLISINMDEFLKGAQTCVKNQAPPMSKEEFEMEMVKVQRTAFNDRSDKNLFAADTFLATNQKNPGYITLEEGKVQYKIEKKSSSDQIVSPESRPVLRYTAKTLDGTILDESPVEGLPLDLRYVFKGFLTGIEGAKEGEHRILYVHPSLAAGNAHPSYPNALLVFDVEVLKANEPAPTAFNNEILEKLVADAHEKLGDKASNAEILESAKAKATEIADKTNEKTHSVKDDIKDAAQTVKEKVKNTAIATVEKTKELAHVVKEKATPMAEAAKEKFHEIAQAVADKTASAADTVKEKGKEAAENIKEKDAVDTVKEKSKDAADTVKEKATDAADATKEKAKEVAQAVKEKAKEAAEKTKESAEKAKEKVKEGAEKTKEGAEKDKEATKDHEPETFTEKVKEAYKKFTEGSESSEKGKEGAAEGKAAESKSTEAGKGAAEQHPLENAKKSLDDAKSSVEQAQKAAKTGEKSSSGK